ncbi:unnamed protein product [Sympodiomycopsis kandeliae]
MKTASSCCSAQKSSESHSSGNGSPWMHSGPSRDSSSSTSTSSRGNRLLVFHPQNGQRPEQVSGPSTDTSDAAKQSSSSFSSTSGSPRSLSSSGIPSVTTFSLPSSPVGPTSHAQPSSPQPLRIGNGSVSSSSRQHGTPSTGKGKSPVSPSSSHSSGSSGSPPWRPDSGVGISGAKHPRALYKSA